MESFLRNREYLGENRTEANGVKVGHPDGMSRSSASLIPAKTIADAASPT